MIGLCQAGRLQEAVALSQVALADYPSYLPIIKTLQSIGRNTGDIALMYDAALFYDAVGGNYTGAVRDALFADQIYCSWACRDVLISQLINRFQNNCAFRENYMVMLSATDRPDIHRAVADCFVSDLLRRMERVGQKVRWSGSNCRHENRRIKVGYVSCDFCCHPMARVIAGLIENHDRGRFEIFAYDFSPEDGSVERARVKNAFENIRLVHEMSHTDVAKLIEDDCIDILIDLKGYTRYARPEIFLLRPAPIQVSFLGYPATSAAPWIDYAIADRHVLPSSERRHWSEAIAYMPQTYYPGTYRNEEVLAAPISSRERSGVPPSRFVFGCFNNPAKITPEVFNAWMQVLCKTPNSILWLYNRSKISRQNLQSHAAKKGIDPCRLLFADLLEHDDHLKRYDDMDLFLDTTPYNAHTTATDALWAGVPVLTCPGRSFASRV